MDEAGVPVRTHSYKCVFEMCGMMGALSDGKSIYDWLRRTVKNPPELLHVYVLRMFCDHGCLFDAQKVFDRMLEKDVVSWTIMISAYAEEGQLDKAIWFFSHMQESGIKPNSSTFTSLLRYFNDSSLLEVGKQIHSYAIRSGLSANVLIETAVSNMYVKCGWLEGAKLVFDWMADRNVVGWTVLLVGYTEAEKLKDAMALFAEMVREGVELDEFVFSIILKACGGLEDLNMGKQIHSYSIKLGMESEVSVGTPLVDFYVKCANFKYALQVFERISEPNDVSWSSIISGYCQIGEFQESVKIFQSLRHKDVVLNSFIYTSIFQACSALADINVGAQAHADAIKKGLVAYLYGKSALVTMYSKCGRLDYAYRVFESIDNPDTVAWTAIICGYAYHGSASEAVRLFTRMQDSAVKPNAVTFIAVLTACSHSGLVTDGKQYLESMSREYGVEPTIDHYDCMVDIYSRAGLLEEALELIESMPFEPDAMSWKSLLGGCWMHRNLKLGKIAAENLIQLDPDDTANYRIMFNLYASFGKWEEAAHFRRLMAERDLRKSVSCSWITVKGKVHRFIVGDKHHPQTEQIYSVLRELKFSSKISRNALLTEEDVGFPEREEQLLDHSERLAIAFGLISTPSNSPIVVFKNIRACNDCHDFAKHVSTVTGRLIVVRDSNRFHHFKSGECSCKDYCALYQLHLVKAETARACIPKEFRLVEAFGYTLGGFFLASYDESPAGVFDELVVLAGLVWSPPASCAWATKVLVNSDEACAHGRKEIGLPSQVARFSKRITAIPRQKRSKNIGFLNMIGMGTTLSDSRHSMDVQVTEVNCPAAEDTSTINLTTLGMIGGASTLVHYVGFVVEAAYAHIISMLLVLPSASSSFFLLTLCMVIVVPALNFRKWMGPVIKMALPSFSGRTVHTPVLLKYSCKIQCRVRAVHPAKVSYLVLKQKYDEEQSSEHICNTMDNTTRGLLDSDQNLSTAVMLSKPILALRFSCMTMQVEAPIIVSDCSKNSLRTC
ncbi:hypothetical protein FNV43_RR25648 [Rhamnella rubrinervis]|uniref:DYW domain-containing protein n=1 Tax=Rhamnella rubrinervis TaxID=2594499 RepID=A0A8K0GNK4_9ROSA|nr:hypothetical protein FNV43_RR25648 [Rhamnella rubrinervis]